MTRPDHIASTGPGRLYRGQTAIDFYGHRRIGMFVAIVVVIVTVVSLSVQDFNLGIDFEGGQAWEVPASETFGVDEAEDVLVENDVSVASSKIQLREAESRSSVAIQIEVVSNDKAEALTQDFADASGTSVDDLSFEFTSPSWGDDITDKAVRALVIFLIIVAIFISIRFEWRMAIAALAAMAHDLLVAVGVYTVFQFEVTPATVIAFLTILGYSLYDTIVVFDRVQENEGKYAGVRMPYPDIVNISMNQVLMRSINTSISSILPVISLLVVGAGLLGAVALSEFALALLVGMIAGVYSSIFVASPLLATLRSSSKRKSRRERLTGEALRAAVVGAGVSGRIGSESDLQADDGGDEDDDHVDAEKTAAVHRPAERILTHPPRPRKKKKR
ncbi:protein translocase subunit SecF [Ilumatobacter nonamiensis]|uniref:protein translocase subunit SecF n=1 Tax=Ilumatobacter nonamiensis TaxID=467093 RepID=UPI00034B13C9|nr:protein translocase subunit SecF [Ilumatobacter nonamiensis]